MKSCPAGGACDNGGPCQPANGCGDKCTFCGTRIVPDLSDPFEAWFERYSDKNQGGLSPSDKYYMRTAWKAAKAHTAAK